MKKNIIKYIHLIFYISISILNINHAFSSLITEETPDWPADKEFFLSCHSEDLFFKSSFPHTDLIESFNLYANARNEYEKNPCDINIEKINNTENALKTLIKTSQKEDINAQTDLFFGATLLHGISFLDFIRNIDISEDAGIFSLFSLLKEKGGDFLKKNERNDTPLHYAAGHGSEYNIKWLLLKNDHIKTQINAQGEHGRTPLHIAAKYAPGFSESRAPVIATLILLGASLTTKDSDGKTPSDLYKDQISILYSQKKPPSSVRLSL